MATSLITKTPGKRYTPRQIASRLGKLTYFTGKRCRRGHLTQRYVSNLSCVACSREVYQSTPQKEHLAASHRNKNYPVATRPQPDDCELCGQTVGTLCLDHDHSTGAFRGWLCSRCNSGLGMLGDTLGAARAAVSYLSRVY